MFHLKAAARMNTGCPTQRIIDCIEVAQSPHTAENTASEETAALATSAVLAASVSVVNALVTPLLVEVIVETVVRDCAAAAFGFDVDLKWHTYRMSDLVMAIVCVVLKVASGSNLSTSEYGPVGVDPASLTAAHHTMNFTI